ncbi:putative methyltransferase [Chlamydia abortus]|nr:putative methyltransferase [Chlamydia abortus]
MKKLTMKSVDLTQANIDKIAELFPNVITEARDEKGKIKRAVDFDLLKQELFDVLVEGEKERYQLTWPGKKQAILNANTPIDKTLRPVKEDSVDWDNTQNLYIEGDNLEVLKLLQESYLNKVNLIYIDPPYNTGKDFIYKDDYKESTKEYLDESGQVDEEGNRLFLNTESNGRFHSDWLTMMYSRLKIARNLMTDDGVILVNIDENEVTNLQKLLNEIYGEQNELGTIIWDKRNPKGDARGIAYQHEYIIAYAKNIDSCLLKNDIRRLKKNAEKILKKAQQIFAKLSSSFTLDDVNREFVNWINSQQDLSGGEKAYNKIDENGDVFRPVSMAWPNKKKAPDDYFIPLVHPITKKPCPVPARGWRNPSATMNRLLEEGRILFGEDETTIPNRKYLLKENMHENIPSLLYFGGSDEDLLNKLDIPFDTPKVVEISKEHIMSFANKDALILDFFSGSATTAHAVMQLNAEDGGNRKYIMVQLPEETDERSEAYKAGYKNICEIGKERIRRAAKMIKEETGADIDYGFRVFRVDSSNMKDVYYTPDKLKQGDMFDLASNIKEDRTGEDLLIQVMLELGLELSLPMETKQIEGKTVHYVAGNSLIACFDDNVSESVIIQIAAEKPLRVVFRDSSFEDDSARINVEELFKMLSPGTEIQVL